MCVLKKPVWNPLYYEYGHDYYEDVNICLAERKNSIFFTRKMTKKVKKPMWWHIIVRKLRRKKTRSWNRDKLDRTEANYTSYKIHNYKKKQSEG